MTQRFLASLAILTAMAGPAAAQEYTFKIGHTNAAGEVQDKGLEKMKELLEAKTDGAATLEIYPGGQLGDESQLIEGVMLGSIDMSMTSNSLLSNYVEITRSSTCRSCFRPSPVSAKRSMRTGT